MVLLEAFEEVLDLGVFHGLGRLVDVHHHGPLEVRHRAGYRVYTVKAFLISGSDFVSRRVALT